MRLNSLPRIDHHTIICSLSSVLPVGKRALASTMSEFLSSLAKMVHGSPLCADDWVVAQSPRISCVVYAPQQELAGWKCPIAHVFVEPDRKFGCIQQVLLKHVYEWRKHPLL